MRIATESCKPVSIGKSGVILSCQKSEGFAFAVIPLLSQTPAPKKPSFEVASVKPGAPASGFRGGGPRGNSEERFQFKAHYETQELPIYNLPQNLPRGAMMMMMNPTTGMTVNATAVSIGNLVGMSQGRAGRPGLDSD